MDLATNNSQFTQATSLIYSGYNNCTCTCKGFEGMNSISSTCVWIEDIVLRYIFSMYM